MLREKKLRGRKKVMDKLRVIIKIKMKERIEKTRNDR